MLGVDWDRQMDMNFAHLKIKWQLPVELGREDVFNFTPIVAAGFSPARHFEALVATVTPLSSDG